ncbi:hypothetical protein [Methanobrevibacter sp.]
MTITVDPSDNTYDMGVFRFVDETLVSNEFEYTIGGSNEVRTATNSQNPTGYKGSKNEFSYSASDIPMEFHDYLIEMKIKKTTFPITVFAFGPDGDYTHVGTLTNARIDEVSVKNGDEGYSLDVSGPALGFDLPK